MNISKSTYEKYSNFSGIKLRDLIKKNKIDKLELCEYFISKCKIIK